MKSYWRHLILRGSRSLVAAAFLAFGFTFSIEAATDNFVYRGAGASIDMIDSEAGTIEVLVGSSGTPQNQQAFLTFFMDWYDPVLNTSNVMYGYGVLPDSALTGKDDSPRLDTDTSLLADFTGGGFSYNWSTGEYSELPSRGIVRIEWDQTNAFFSQSSGSYREVYRFPDGSLYESHVVGPFERQSARARGSIYGRLFDTRSAATMSFKTVNIQIQRTPK